MSERVKKEESKKDPLESLDIDLPDDLIDRQFRIHGVAIAKGLMGKDVAKETKVRLDQEQRERDAKKAELDRDIAYWQDQQRQLQEKRDRLRAELAALHRQPAATPPAAPPAAPPTPSAPPARPPTPEPALMSSEKTSEIEERLRQWLSTIVPAIIGNLAVVEVGHHYIEHTRLLIPVVIDGVRYDIDPSSSKHWNVVEVNCGPIPPEPLSKDWLKNHHSEYQQEAKQLNSIQKDWWDEKVSRFALIPKPEHPLTYIAERNDLTGPKIEAQFWMGDFALNIVFQFDPTAKIETISKIGFGGELKPCEPPLPLTEESVQRAYNQIAGAPAEPPRPTVDLPPLEPLAPTAPHPLPGGTRELLGSAASPADARDQTAQILERIRKESKKDDEDVIAKLRQQFSKKPQ